MDIETLRNYCLAKKQVTESCPFGEGHLVFKVCDKMFALLSLNEQQVNLKCDPEKAIELREQFVDTVLPGYHMNKAQWNTIIIGRAPNKLLLEWIDDSYRLVVAKLPKKVQATLNES